MTFDKKPLGSSYPVGEEYFVAFVAGARVGVEIDAARVGVEAERPSSDRLAYEIARLVQLVLIAQRERALSRLRNLVAGVGPMPRVKRLHGLCRGF